LISICFFFARANKELEIGSESVYYHLLRQNDDYLTALPPIIVPVAELEFGRNFSSG
jgi:hypothetical protein